MRREGGRAGAHGEKFRDGRPDNPHGLRLYAYYTLREFNENNRLMISISLVVLGCMVPLAFLLAAFLPTRMYRPIETLVGSMNR